MEVELHEAHDRFELQFGEKSYVDYVLLYKQEGHWVVVAKTTFIETEPT